MSEAAPGPPGTPGLLWLSDVYDPLTPFMDDLWTCVCRTFALAGRAVCHCHQYGGDSPPPADDCACKCLITVVDPDTGNEVEMRASGQAWVRLVQVAGESYNRRSSGAAGGSRGWGACVTDTPFRVIVEVGVYRCVAVPQDNGQPPTVEERTADARQLHADVAVLWRIRQCCPVLVGAELDRIEPMGPAGGCAGASMRLWLELDDPATMPPDPDQYEDGRVARPVMSGW